MNQNPSENIKPLVSIAIPIYNEEKYLSETLDGLLAQDYENTELVISDNASQDGTKAICEKYAAKNPRIRYYRLDKTITATENFNHAFKLCQGEFFMWSGGHDQHDRSFISTCLREMLHDPQVVLCYTDILPMTADGKPLKVLLPQLSTQGILGPVLRCILVFWHIGGYESAGLFRASALRKTQLLTVNTIGPDLIFLSELALYGTFACVHKPLLFVRLKWTSEEHFKDVLDRYSKNTYFWQKNTPVKFPNWKYLYTQIRTLAQTNIGLRRKLFLIPAVSLIYLAKNHRLLLADLGRSLRSKPKDALQSHPT